MDRFTVHFQDYVPGQNARLVGGGAVDWRYDQDLAFLHGDIGADSFEGAFQAGLVQPYGVGGEESCVALITKRGEHSFNGAVSHSGEVYPLAIDKVGDDVIPGFPEDEKPEMLPPTNASAISQKSTADRATRLAYLLRVGRIMPLVPWMRFASHAVEDCA